LQKNKISLYSSTLDLKGLCFFNHLGIVAQRLEQDAHNVLVAGSIPADPTIIKAFMSLDLV
jgi:hypothetical protein